MRNPRRIWLAWAVIFWLAGLAGGAQAQQVRPADELPPPLLPGQGEAPAPALEPPVEEAPAETPAGPPVHTPLGVEVTSFRVTGSSVFDAAQLQQALAPWTGRRLNTADLLAARDAITALYVDAGYLTSGAVLPDQEVADGVVEIRLIEGRLGAVDVSGVRWFRPRYFESRLRGAAGTPVSAVGLERELQILQRNPRIARIEARLVPGPERGVSVLEVDVVEASPFTAVYSAANDISPAIGAYEGGVDTSFTNAIGLGDVWSFAFNGGAGLLDYMGAFSIPITRWDTTFGVRYRNVQSEIVEADFGAVYIVSELEEYGFTLAQPLLRRGPHDLWAAVALDRRRSQSFIERVAFCFEIVTPDCSVQETVIRPSLSYTFRDADDALALRGMLSIGLDVGDTSSSSVIGDPDGEFLAFLGQASWAHVFDGALRDPTLVSRLDMQFASRPLLSIERFAIGGMRTVRGYAENSLVRDQGVVGSVELRIPLLVDRLDARRIELIPFVDVGHGWNVKSPARADTLASVGLGLSMSPFSWMVAEIYWGLKLLPAPFETSDALQQDGISFSVQLGAW
jgi:hemolysin activation/secretion protein